MRKGRVEVGQDHAIEIGLHRIAGLPANCDINQFGAPGDITRESRVRGCGRARRWTLRDTITVSSE